MFDSRCSFSIGDSIVLIIGPESVSVFVCAYSSWAGDLFFVKAKGTTSESRRCLG